MATQTVKLASHPGQIGTTLQLWSIDTLLLVQSVPAVETVWMSGLYTASFTDAPAANYRVLHYGSDGDLLWTSCVVLELVTATFQAHDGAFISSVGFDRSVKSIAFGTVGAASSTTSVVSSVCTPAGAVADQFKNKLIQFAADTTTAALRGQMALISASSNAAAPTFTVSALTTAPVSGDTFVIT